MGDYIEREKVVLSVLGLTIIGPAVASYAGAVLHQVQNVPAADVAPIVRCKECKHGDDFGDEIACYHPIYDLAEGVWSHEKDYFCAYGERKEGAG